MNPAVISLLGAITKLILIYVGIKTYQYKKQKGNGGTVYDKVSKLEVEQKLIKNRQDFLNSQIKDIKSDVKEIRKDVKQLIKGGK